MRTTLTWQRRTVAVLLVFYAIGSTASAISPTRPNAASVSPIQKKRLDFCDVVSKEAGAAGCDVPFADDTMKAVSLSEARALSKEKCMNVLINKLKQESFEAAAARAKQVAEETARDLCERAS